MSGRVYLLGLVALALAVMDAALGPRPRVTEENVRRIRPGMTMREVNALLGPIPSNAPHLCMNPMGYTVILDDGAGTALLTFNLADTVSSVDFQPIRKATILVRLRAWLGW
jgi:hypothetical protein